MHPTKHELRQLHGKAIALSSLVEGSVVVGPSVSVVMPTRGRSTYVERAITSVLNQSYRDFELLILDNSPDPEKKKIREMSESDSRILFVNRGGIGVTEARKLGASISRGKLFALLDSDDYWSLDRLEKHCRVWKNNKIGMSWDRWAEVSQGIVNIVDQPFREGIVQPPRLAARLYWFNFIHASAGIVATSFARALGFPIRGIMSSDWPLFMRAAEYYPAYFIGECLSYKETMSPERVSNMETREFFESESKTIRHWAMRHRPEIYGLEYIKRRTRGLIRKLKRRPRPLQTAIRFNG
jgi:glycosyltransferase involved in cell wall biosynthesis